MSKLKVALVAGSVKTMTALTNQLKEYTGDEVNITGYSIDEGIDDTISEEIVVVSSKLAMEELSKLGVLDAGTDCIVAQRTISYDHLDKVVEIAQNTKVLLVNDTEKSSIHVIEHLKLLGLDSLEYVQYYPGRHVDLSDVEIAITPGEVDKVPEGIETVIDIDSRIMDFQTITQILNKLQILSQKSGLFSDHYLIKIINIAKRLAQSRNKIIELNTHLENVIDDLSHGVLVYDHNGRIIVFNESLRTIISTHQTRVVGKPLKRVIHNSYLLEYLMNPGEVNEKIIDFDGREVIVSKVATDQGKAVLASFKKLKEAIDESDRMKREYISRGLYAKYTIDDIIGSSRALERVKSITEKLGASELTMLIEGESGTGKELFASAIHNVSGRHNGPFLAVNFSALPDELIESELFGYEEGAFTGAKKGGKVGLFEQADGGTIFLDEIGDTSLKLQARLLRVLQEKEIMRIGAADIKSIDVRVVAATNKDLYQMVQKNEFREDLYYRLKMGYLKLPPLRERKEDIPAILQQFAETERVGAVVIDPQVIEELGSYDWYGNVRELKNTFMYMLAVSNGHTITKDCIPDKGFFKSYQIESTIATGAQAATSVTEETVFILNAIKDLNDRNLRCGREKLAGKTKGTQFEMSPAQIRNRLDKLERQGYVLKKKGKHGTVLTPEGLAVLMANGDQ